MVTTAPTSTCDPPTREEWEDMDPEEWPRSAFETYGKALDWYQAKQARRTAETVEAADRDLRLYGYLAGYLVLAYLVYRGMDDVSTYGL